MRHIPIGGAYFPLDIIAVSDVLTEADDPSKLAMLEEPYLDERQRLGDLVVASQSLLSPERARDFGYGATLMHRTVRLAGRGDFASLPDLTPHGVDRLALRVRKAAEAAGNFDSAAAVRQAFWPDMLLEPDLLAVLRHVTQEPSNPLTWEAGAALAVAGLRRIAGMGHFHHPA